MDNNNKKGDVILTTKAQKWGNSIGVRIPFRVANKYGIENGSPIEMEEKEDGICVRPVEKEPSLDEMLDQITDENRHDYIDFGKKGDELL
ncbi:antitoxin MazE [Virgibacillus natechei]|uniref:Antitoxin MazE n=1 Tax=Virgibacillus natechei TaxID=1216297 RepID=A0ABS4IHE6_9BACI|nr:AbrB/MazE/SpoVT family DNA-binding domain-containing protein [Virgibacillus natechei]MBP1970368.1 antitoxin MazE [Virgibacillus natechei]UZD13192.1 AbrB/MazE/SpoVT family DNA-binding domain-containing protein [Virgibacillus natechei]